MEKRPHIPVEGYRQEMEAQIADLKERIEVSRTQHLLDIGTLAAERDRLRRELDTASALAPQGTAWGSRVADLENAREKIEQERKAIQKKAIEFREREEMLRDRERKLEEERGGDSQEKIAEARKGIQKKADEFRDREEALRDRERKVEEESGRLAVAREQVELRRSEVEAAKAGAPAFDQDAAKREIDQRVMILQQKAFDLMAREELLKKRAEEIQALLNIE